MLNPFVLMYHSVGKAVVDPFELTVTADRLDKQLRSLRRLGFLGVSMVDLLAKNDKRCVGLTFDDGYCDFLDVAVPILQRHRCTATVFALPGRLGGMNSWDESGDRKRLMTADGLKMAAAAGMEVASHGMLHARLSALDDDALENEVRGSKEKLEGVLGSPIAGFAYPFGDFNGRIERSVVDAGYDYACAVRSRPSASVGSIHSIQRVGVRESDSVAKLCAKRIRDIVVGSAKP
jgi:peptidoglycan/xylan/chitin deacetylase (PgdA/CDA1 family)